MLLRKITTALVAGYIAVILLAALILALTLSTAHATPQCGHHDDQAASLAKEFGEAVQSQALTGGGMLAEIFVNPVTGTWTVMLTRPDGVSCLLTSGDQFQAVKPGDPA